jgi:anaerobic selenocysteine-containing dehydrogenase
MKRLLRTTCPRDCYDGCGIAVEIEGDRVERVLGDPDHPVSRGKLCGKCALAYNGVWRDRDARLSRPLRRTRRKGEGRFAPVSWEDALAEIAEQLHGVVAQQGAESVLHAHYTGTGTRHSPTSTGRPATASIPRRSATAAASSSGAPTPPPRDPTPTSTGCPSHRGR